MPPLSGCRQLSRSCPAHCQCSAIVNGSHWLWCRSISRYRYGPIMTPPDRNHTGQEATLGGMGHHLFPIQPHQQGWMANACRGSLPMWSGFGFIAVIRLGGCRERADRSCSECYRLLLSVREVRIPGRSNVIYRSVEDSGHHEERIWVFWVLSMGPTGDQRRGPLKKNIYRGLLILSSTPCVLAVGCCELCFRDKAYWDC